MGHLVNPIGKRIGGCGNIFWSNNFSFFFDQKNLN